MKDISKQAENYHARLLSQLLDINEKMQQHNFRELADIGYYLKWVSQILDELRKECDRTSAVAQKVACLQWMQMENRGDKLVTDEYSATPDVTSSCSFPSRSKDPEAYDAFMTWLGIPDQLIEKELCRVHWPNFSEHFTEMQAEGKPLPPGIDPNKVHSQFKLRYRTKKKV